MTRKRRSLTCAATALLLIVAWTATSVTAGKIDDASPDRGPAHSINVRHASKPQPPPSSVAAIRPAPTSAAAAAAAATAQRAGVAVAAAAAATAKAGGSNPKDSVVVVLAGRYVSNLSGGCLRCLCLASTVCNATIGCSKGYCGPYYLHREYWNDAGRVVMQDDDPERDQAFVDCASDLSCSQKIVENYMSKWGRDCNKDGVTDCDDYARTHFNGREDCSAIERTNFWRRYETCRPTDNSKGW